MIKFKGFQDFEVSLDDKNCNFIISQYDPYFDSYETVYIPVSLWLSVYESGLSQLGGGLE